MATQLLRSGELHPCPWVHVACRSGSRCCRVRGSIRDPQACDATFASLAAFFSGIAANPPAKVPLPRLLLHVSPADPARVWRLTAALPLNPTPHQMSELRTLSPLHTRLQRRQSGWQRHRWSKKPHTSGRRLRRCGQPTGAAAASAAQASPPMVTSAATCTCMDMPPLSLGMRARRVVINKALMQGTRSKIAGFTAVSHAVGRRSSCSECARRGCAQAPGVVDAACLAAAAHRQRRQRQLGPDAAQSGAPW